MKIITTRDFRSGVKTYFDLAEEERVVLKRGKKYVNFIVTDEPDVQFLDEAWVNDLFAIPEEYRCNPFDVSPSGDLYWADKRNVEEIKKRLKEPRDGDAITLRNAEELKSFFDSL